MQKNSQEIADELVKRFQGLNTGTYQTADERSFYKGAVGNFEARAMIFSMELEGKALMSSFIMGIHFKKCSFNRIGFVSCHFSSCIFEDCTFNDCDFDRGTFLTCNFESNAFISCGYMNIDFVFSQFSNNTFTNVNRAFLINIRSSTISDLKFESCFFNNFTLSNNIFDQEKKGIIFQDCLLDSATFTDVNLSTSRLINTLIMGNVFVNSILSEQTLLGAYQNGEDFCSIDLQTILKSESLSSVTLKEIFNVYDDSIKFKMQDMVTETKFQSVFISYSFIDGLFAKRLNDVLVSKGITTFLWEYDAPGGRKLLDIMSDGIKNHERLLFIASENSIKSPACHFELSEGRIKQDKLWKTILYPIHIDNFLFSVRKDDVRPKESREEFWKNIEELREINSLNFSDFNKAEYDRERFEEKVKSLIKELKIKSN